MIFEKLNPELNKILWFDHDHSVHDSILGYLWGICQVYCDPVFAAAQGYDPL
jgi:hypothetical protein